MTHADFVHLHVHSEYSLLDGACRLDRLVDKAHALRFPALALTDHGVLYGAVDFYQKAREKGIKPIIGCEVYVAPGSRFEKKTTSGGRDVYHHLVLLAKNETGYRNLLRLVTAAHLEGFYYKPRVDKELLAAHKDGLLALSGCLAGEIPELIQRDQVKQACAAVDWFRQTFGPENFYLELQNHGLPEQVKVNQQLVAWAKEFGLGLVATNDVHYLEKSHSHAHDCLLCIGTQTTLNDPKRLGASYPAEQFHLRSAEEMKGLFQETPEALLGTLEVAEKCNVELEFGNLRYPVFDPPAPWTREGYLRQLLAEGLYQRYTIRTRVQEQRFVVEGVEDPRRLPPASCAGGAATPVEQARPSAAPAQAERAEERWEDSAPAAPVAGASQESLGAAVPAAAADPRCAPGAGPELSDPATAKAVWAVLDRLELELRTIEHTKFVSYFLIVGDFVRYGRSKGIACVARGSAAGSLVTYLLAISNVDPLRHGLLFERFLNPERVNPPDIDIDFADDRRGDVIAYVRQKYGQERVAQIITFGTLGAKSVLRDVGRVMGLPFGEGDKLAKLVPNDPKINLEGALKQSPELKAAYDDDPTTHELISTAYILEDLARNASVHAAGVVIGDQPLVNLVPLKQEDEGALVTQYPMGPLGELGLMKMDLLGLKTLTVIRNTCELIKRTKGVEVPIDELPSGDPKTYDLLNKANTLGVFQLESGGMRDLCRKFRINSLEHITALIALYRPGPMELIPEFLRRRHGELRTEYEHPLLEPICRETYGIMIYQEQVMQAAQVLAGYTLGGADLLRRAMGKKKKEEMAGQRDGFVKGCARTNNIPPAKANQIYDLLEKFAGYGFNKSHAAAYAVVAYQTAYLKANYPVEFLCAMMTNDMADTDKLSQYIEEARAFGVEVLPPDVNESGVAFTPARQGAVIRFGLAAVKGVGEVAVESILEARRRAPFRSLAELCERVDTRAVNRKVLEALIKCGACDGFGETRATLIAALEGALARGASLAHDRARGQASLFGLLADQAPPDLAPLQRLPEFPQHELLAVEKELLGFYVTGHPLSPYAPILEKYCLATTVSLATAPNRSMTRVGGLVAAVQTGVAKKSNKLYALVTLEDLHGSVQVLCLDENYEKYRELLVLNRALLVAGEVNTGDDKPKVFPTEILPLEEAPKRYTLQVHFRLNAPHLSEARLAAARQLAQAHPGKCPLYLCLRETSGAVVFIQAHDSFAVTPSVELQKAANDLFGEETYYAKVDTSTPPRQQRRWERREEAEPRVVEPPDGF